MTIARFMATPVGRGIRIAAGLALFLSGSIVHGTRGWTIAAIGLLPLATGVYNSCLLAPLFDGPFNGRDVRP